MQAVQPCLCSHRNQCTSLKCLLGTPAKKASFFPKKASEHVSCKEVLRNSMGRCYHRYLWSVWNTNRGVNYPVWQKFNGEKVLRCQDIKISISWISRKIQEKQGQQQFNLLLPNQQLKQPCQTLLWRYNPPKGAMYTYATHFHNSEKEGYFTTCAQQFE